MTVISVALPRELLKKFDHLVSERGYFSRSEAFRDAVRNLISEAELGRIESEMVAATVITITSFERKDVIMKLTELRHEFEDVVVENIHRHVGEAYCLDVFVTEGNKQRILDLVSRIRGLRYTLEVKTAFMPLSKK